MVPALSPTTILFVLTLFLSYLRLFLDHISFTCFLFCFPLLVLSVHQNKLFIFSSFSLAFHHISFLWFIFCPLVFLFSFSIARLVRGSNPSPSGTILLLFSRCWFYLFSSLLEAIWNHSLPSDNYIHIHLIPSPECSCFPSFSFPFRSSCFSSVIYLKIITKERMIHWFILVKLELISAPGEEGREPTWKLSNHFLFVTLSQKTDKYSQTLRDLATHIW